MSEQTPRHEPASYDEFARQKHITHNEALTELMRPIIFHCPAMDVNDPPVKRNVGGVVFAVGFQSRAAILSLMLASWPV